MEDPSQPSSSSNSKTPHREEMATAYDEEEGLSSPGIAAVEDDKDQDAYAAEQETGIDADNDDDDEIGKQSSWRKKLFGKKKIMRRKKKHYAAKNSSSNVDEEDAGLAGKEDLLDDSIVATTAADPLQQQLQNNHPQQQHKDSNNKQKRPTRQRAKATTTAAVMMYPATKFMDDSESDYLTDKGIESIDYKNNNTNAVMTMAETALPQRSHNHHTNARRHYHQGRTASTATSDGYENSGHETSDYINTDFYMETEDDRDIDDGSTNDDDADDDRKILLSLLDLKDNDTDNEKKESAAAEGQKQKLTPQTAPSTPLSQTKTKKKRQQRRRNKSKKSNTTQTPQKSSVDGTPINQQTQEQQEEQPIVNSMQEEEELDCHTPMKTTVQQSQLQQTPKRRSRQPPTKQTTQQQQLHDGDDDENEDEEHDPHEDEDDYPPNIMYTPTNTKKKEDEESEAAEVVCRPCSTGQRTLDEELSYLKRISSTRYQVQLGFVPNMKVPAEIIVNNDLETLLVQELRDSCCGNDGGGGGGSSFIPALRQAANVAALPGIVRASLAMPDVHSGYGFCIGNVAAFDMDDDTAVISPGGVGFDINCGVRLLRTNLTEDDIDETIREKLAEAMFRNIPVGVGAGGDIPCSITELDELLVKGIDWAIEKRYAWKEDKEHCEENGCMDTADPKFVSKRAKKRGLKQLGTLGAGNHYAEIQVVDEIYHHEAAKTMGIGKVGQVCVMIHTGSRGLGHQVATDALTAMERAMARDKIDLNDRQLSCARISSREGKEYLAAMSSAANFAWVNRSCITYLTRKAFADVFGREADKMDMHLVYDVCHNIAKVEKHVVDGVEKTLLVHRKGSTRAFPPEHPNIPKDYQKIGQPVLIGGTMGTCSYVLVGTAKGMTETFGSTCHGAGRALSRNQSRKKLDHAQVLSQLQESGISIRVASPKLVTEEAPESYKNVSDVIETCQDAGISKKVVKLRPIAVIKG